MHKEKSSNFKVKKPNRHHLKQEIQVNINNKIGVTEGAVPHCEILPHNVELGVLSGPLARYRWAWGCGATTTRDQHTWPLTWPPEGRAGGHGLGS